MNELKFRDLNKDEIEIRVGSTKEKGLSLLLYKDARCDMNILDETVGAFNWKRSHSVINDNLFAEVCLWDSAKGQWVCKQDVGVESYTEKQKGEASDSFKRACFNWGIGRKLYTSPFIWISGESAKMKYDKWRVKEIEYDEYRITKLVIVNVKTNKVVFSSKGELQENEKLTQQDEIELVIQDTNIDLGLVKKWISIKHKKDIEVNDLTRAQFSELKTAILAKIAEDEKEEVKPQDFMKE